MVDRLKQGDLTDCTREALSQPDLVVTENPSFTCTDCPLSEGYTGRGAITARLEYGGKIYGVLTVSIPKEIVPDTQEQELIQEIAMDIGLRIDKIEEKKKQDQLKKTLALTRFSIDHANDMLYWVGSDGKIVDANATTCKNLGYSQDEILSMGFDDVDPNISLEEYLRIWEGLKQSGTSTLETVHHTKDGRSMPVEINLSFVEFNGQEYNCAFARDITERKQAESHLRKHMAELKERVKELNCLFEISRLVEKRANSIEQILQGTAELIPPAWQYPEITTSRIMFDGQEFKTNNFKKTIWKQSNDIIVHGKTRGVLEVFYQEERPLSDEGPFLKEERSLINAITERLGRIIERRQAQAALRESEQRFRNLIENSLTGISIVQDDRIVYQNQEQERLFGPIPRSTILEFVEDIHPDDVEKVRHLYENITSGKAEAFETDFRFYSKPDKTERRNLIWVNCRASLIEYHGSNAILVNVMDVTRIRELENLVRIQDKMASLGRVAAGIAHEIRNPLSGINIYLNTLEKIYNRDGNLDKVNVILEHLQSASNKIESVIKRVMDFAKPSEPKFVLTDINKPIEEAINLSAVTLRKSGIKIEKRLAENLPLCHADLNLIEEVVLNLITNGSEAMKHMEENKKIVIESSYENNRILLTVSDSGPGVPLNVRDKIFDPFYTTKPEGSGIGLSLSQRIISDHGGSMEITDSKWGGAEFVIEIPIKDSNT
jgi:PAS domain S-box-containing protein